jgi:hypothetical protein
MASQVVAPDDRRMQHDVLIPPNGDVGRMHAAGQIVICEITDPPRPRID